MKTFYTILYANIRPSVDERVSIGLLLRNEQQYFFEYSTDKLDIIKGLFTAEAFGLLRNYLKNLKSYLSLPPETIGISDLPMDTHRKDFLEASYVEYLSRYSNNLIAFDTPKIIDIPFQQETFDRLFVKYVFGLQKKITHDIPSIVEKVRTQLYPQIQSFVNIDTLITPEVLPTLVTPAKVSFVGLNEVPVAGQVADFEKRPYDLEGNINRLIVLQQAFEWNNAFHGKYYVIGDEPPKYLTSQHTLWHQVRTNKHLSLISSDETEQIYDYMQVHGVTPLVS